MNQANTPLVDLDFDRRHVWHPYTSANPTQNNYPVIAAQGCELEFEDGTKVIDGMASWWSAIHGYQVAEINAAIEHQIGKMAHVMFGGLTHAPAVELCKKLVAITPEPLQRVFISDSGSVSVEVALKMALQYWQGAHQPQKSKFMTVRNGYHGDTFATMSVCDPVNGMHTLFSDVLHTTFFISAPKQGFEKPVCPDWQAELEQAFATHHQQMAAFIIEPVVQGAGGMRIYSPDYIKAIHACCQKYDVLLITDEIATGFGRTGALFAVEHTGICPDILCLGKALTGGTMSLAATLCTDKVAETVCQSAAGVFMHGPTFMGNPLACAVANASLELLLSSPWQQRVQAIEAQLQQELTKCAELESVANVRVLGAIGVVETKEAVDVAKLQAKVIEQGGWIRPFGKLVYIMPPYVIQPKQLTQLVSAIYAGLLEL